MQVIYRQKDHAKNSTYLRHRLISKIRLKWEWTFMGNDEFQIYKNSQFKSQVKTLDANLIKED